MTVTVTNYRGRYCAWVCPVVGIVFHSLAELYADGFRPVPGSRGEWVRL